MGKTLTMTVVTGLAPVIPAVHSGTGDVPNALIGYVGSCEEMKFKTSFFTAPLIFCGKHIQLLKK